MKIIKEYFIPVLLLCVFAFLMLSTNIMKAPMGQEDDVIQKILDIEMLIRQENWEASDASYDELIKAWNQVLFRIQLSVDKDIIFSFEDLLALLKGAIVAKNNQHGIIYSEALQVVWETLGE